MNNVDDEWEKYLNDEDNILDDIKEDDKQEIIIPKCSELYISTKTKIAYLNREVDLNKIFWEIPILDYHEPMEGVIKKQIKVNCDTKEEVKILEEKIKNTNNIKYDVIQQIDNPNGRKIKFKDVRKINIGVCSNDLITKKRKRQGHFITVLF